MRFVCLFLMLAGALLRADPVEYTWEIPPTTSFVTQSGLVTYSGTIEIPGGEYCCEQVQYEGVTFDVDVATFNYPAPDLVDFFVMTVAPKSSAVPEPVTWPAMVVFFTLLFMTINARRRQKSRRENAVLNP
ncbi:MAG: hypothetical protein JOZ32_12150 [Bryobacterales bacterium]|nr:hypothetical protein [Bryobacterales bacterium]